MKSGKKIPPLLKSVILAALIAGPLFAFNASAQTLTTDMVWDSAHAGLSGFGFWPNTNAWHQFSNNVDEAYGSIPVGTTQVHFGVPGASPCIVNGSAVAGRLAVGDEGSTLSSPATLIITNGGTLSMEQVDFTTIGYNQPGELDVESGGTVNVSGDFWVGQESGTTGTFIMNGGTVTVTGRLGLGWDGGIGQAHINGGTFNVATWVPGSGSGNVSISDASTLDIAGGAVVINGNQTNSVNSYVTAGRITAYGGSGTVNVDYNVTHAGDTTITASNGSGGVTKIISLSGDLAFGYANVSSSNTLNFTIGNSGNTTLTVSNINYPAGFSGDWSGAVAAGGSTNVTVSFLPTAAVSYGGSLTVVSDATGGVNTLAISGAGQNTTTVSGTGNVFITNTVTANGRMILSWNSRGTLEMATNAAGPWTAVTNSWPYTNLMTGPTSFFRLNQTVDATTLHKKILCGYQGWFRCAGDDGGVGDEWDHWSRDWGSAPTTSDLTFEMWPDLTEYTNNNQYPVPGFTYPGGAQAYLYSAMDQATVNLHFDWMRDYGIDGVVVQRFVTALPPQNTQAWKSNVLFDVQAACHRTGRTFSIEYDMSGNDTNTLFYQLTNDWAFLNSQGIPQDPRYMHHNGKPVVMVFGFYAPDSQASPPEFTNSIPLDLQIISWFKTNSIQPATLIGQGEWQWATEATAGWSNLFAHCDGFCPWNTGNYSNDGGITNATTSPWTAGQAFANKVGMLFWPQIYPGYSASHLTGGPFNLLPRRGGNFLWAQVNTLANLGIDTAYLGMFDEVDEGTAIYKVSNNPPTQAQFVTYDEDGYTLPTDWYLRLTAEASKVLSGERPNTPTIPISP